jgi:hypothetical protein
MVKVAVAHLAVVVLAVAHQPSPITATKSRSDLVTRNFPSYLSK